MRPILLIDFGSTCTKVTAVDMDSRRILGTAQDFTSAETDISDGLSRAVGKLFLLTGKIDFSAHLACSSAAGGLRMLACGLVPSLTAEAARLAALGAGAKVIKTYSYQLTRDDANEIHRLNPDIFLLTGGTDGGNVEAILHNSHVLAQIGLPFPVIFAGNRSGACECSSILAASAHPVHIVENVMPYFGKLNVGPVQDCIRQLFLERIVAAKGLSKVQELLDGILMPTPLAVLSALSLLSDGFEEKKGIGDLMAVDLGGATTDVYSIASGYPVSAATVMRGLPEPYAKRTVEGDIGMRLNARGIVDSSNMSEVMRLSGLSEKSVEELLVQIDHDKTLTSYFGDLADLDFALAVLAVRIGLLRHSGTIKQVFTPSGAAFLQTGKDLTEVGKMILTGGALIHTCRWLQIAEEAMKSSDIDSLIPKHAIPMPDDGYILSAMGLLQTIDKAMAFEIMMNKFGRDVPKWN